MILGFCVDDTGLGKPINYKITKNSKKLISDNKKKLCFTKTMYPGEGLTPYDIEDDSSENKEELVVKNN